MTQISTIKPVDVTKPKVKPNFTFDDNAYLVIYSGRFRTTDIGPREGRKGDSFQGLTLNTENQSPDKDNDKTISD